MVDADDSIRRAESLAGEGKLAEAVELLVPLADGPAPSHKLLSVLSSLLKALGRPDAALLANRKATTLYPESGVAWHNLAATLGDIGQPLEAKSAAERAFATHIDAPETWLVYARALHLLGEFDGAENAFRETLLRRPNYLEAAVELARLIWMRTGDMRRALDPLDAALRAGAPEIPGVLWKERLLKAGGAQAEGRALLDAALGRSPSNISLLLAAAQAQLESGDLDYGERLSARAEALAPADASVQLRHAALLLARGDTAQALIRARRATELEPDNQAAWGWLATTARATDDAAYRELYDYPRFVRTYDIEPPAGWRDTRGWLADLAMALRRLNTLSFHPPEQTIRGGAQTAVELSTHPDPTIAGFFTAIERPIRAYMDSVGNEPSHPLTRRNARRYRISGSWSVLLRPSGFHVDHFHPKGWISSAFYVEVPESALGTASREGWIRFGQPPFRTSPPMDAEYFVRPVPGRLVLFPSYMWHGTVPFTTPESRLTIAFDAVPA